IHSTSPTYYNFNSYKKQDIPNCFESVFNMGPKRTVKQSDSEECGDSSSGKVNSKTTNKKQNVDKRSDKSKNLHTLPAIKKRKVESQLDQQGHEGDFFFEVEELVSQTKKNNDELRELLSGYNLINSVDVSIMFEKPVLINIPELGEKKFQNRFNFKEGKIPFICRRNCTDLFNKVMNSLDESNNSRGLYIYGPSGLGKSYSIYYLATQLRLFDNDYRVTYINSCDEWYLSHRNEPYEYLLKELIRTFSDDELSPFTLTDWIEFVMKGITKRLNKKLDELKNNTDFAETIMAFNKNFEDRFAMFLKGLRNYIKNKYFWIWIFDQYNALYKNKALNDRPFSLVKELTTFLNKAGLIIVSASANNEEYPNEFDSWQIFTIYDGYDDDEFEEWCRLCGYDYHNLDIKPHLDELRYLTNSIPLELDKWHRIKGNNLRDKISTYKKSRGKEIARQHEKFRSNLSPDKLINLKQCVATMVLKTVISDDVDYGLNRQFMYEKTIRIRNDIEIKTYAAIHPIAEQAIKNSHSEHYLHFKNDLERVASSVFEGGYSNDVKGRLAETYITTVLEIEKRVQFEIILPYENVDLSKTTFFFPVSSNYPGVDFLIWDHENRILFAFQITIGNLKNYYESRDKFMAEGSDSLINKWAEFCGVNKNK
ncbi:16287_t:CDS:2, partial [Cetraspora pellucida]